MGLVDSLGSILDHPKIAMPKDEYERILENKRIYTQQFGKVYYLSSEGKQEERDYHSLNVAKIAARKMSKLIFNEGCEIKADEDNANEFLENVFRTNKFRKNFGDELEAGYAISGLVLRPYVDGNQIKIAYCHADSFFPLESNTNDISEAAISTVTQMVEDKKTIYYTLLEFHEWVEDAYVISNELYRSEDKGKVGIRVPLTALDKYADLEASVILKGFSRPLFVYIRLAGKNNANLNSPLGAGIIDNGKKQLLDINDKYDQFMWEIDKAASKILASDHFFTVRYDTKGNPIQRFDSKTDIYQRLKTDEPFIDAFAPSLRATEYIESINFLLRIFEMQTGFSVGTFSFDGETIKTATEVISDNTETFSTRSDNVLIIEDALKELVITIFELARAYGLYAKDPGDVSIDFDDGVFVSKEAQLDYNLKAVQGDMMPIVEAIKRQFGLTDKEAKTWYNNIQHERSGLDYKEIEEKDHEKIYGSGE
nr:phage portal protein [Aequitasia blattaphilus]